VSALNLPKTPYHRQAKRKKEKEEDRAREGKEKDNAYWGTEMLVRASNRAISSFNWLIRFLSERNVNSRT